MDDEKTKIGFADTFAQKADIVLTLHVTKPRTLTMTVLKNKYGPQGGLLFTLDPGEEEELRDGENNR